MERRRIIERTSRAREAKRRRTGGRAEGLVGMPRGVNFDPKTSEWSYVEPEATRVRKVFRLFLEQDLNLAEIARRCELWGAGAIRSVLTQHLYRGVYRVDRRWSKGRAVPRAIEDIYEHRVIEPGLISDQQFGLAQTKLASRKARRLAKRRPRRPTQIYEDHLICAECGCAVVTVRDSRDYTGYRCAAIGRGCGSGQVSTRIADSQIDTALEAMLGDRERLRELLEKSLATAERHAGIDGPGIEHRLIKLDGRRSRAQDAYEEGLYELPELRKKLDAIESERVKLLGLMAELGRDIEIDPGLLTEVALTFATWSFLTQKQKRKVLKGYGARIEVRRAKRRVLEVVRLDLQSVAIGWIYKKMKRLNVE